MNDKLTIFLAKLQQVLNGLDEIDDMIGNNSSDQSNVDTLLEDYKHLIEENGQNMSDDAKINMINSYYKARQIRRRNNNFYEIIKYYNNNKQKLQYKAGRQTLHSELKNRLGSLDNSYKYRILTDDEVNNLIHYVDNNTCEETECETQHNNRKKKLSKEELEKCLLDGKKTKEIAKMYNISEPYVSVLKKQYKLKTRDYKKGDK